MTLPSGALTAEELIIACKNIGFDLTCGRCAELFYTGVQRGPCEPGCGTRYDGRPVGEEKQYTFPNEPVLPPALATAMRIMGDPTNRSVTCPLCNVTFLTGAAKKDKAGRPICIECGAAQELPNTPSRKPR